MAKTWREHEHNGQLVAAIDVASEATGNLVSSSAAYLLAGMSVFRRHRARSVVGEILGYHVAR